MRNPDIRQAAKEAGVRLWLIAERVGYSDSGFSRLLRRTLPDEFRSRVLEEIKKLQEEKNGSSQA